VPPSRERVVGPTYRRRPRRACADRAADARARRRVRRRASSDITALSFCCSLRHRPSSVIVREPTLATPSDCRAASELALPRCRASRLLHLSPWRLTNNAGSRAVSRQGSTIHVFDIVAGIGRRSARLRRQGPWPRRGDSRVRSPSRRSAPLASSPSRSLFSTVISASHQATCQYAVNAHGASHSARRSSVLAVLSAFLLFWAVPHLRWEDRTLARAFEPGRQDGVVSLSQVCHVTIPSSRAKAQGRTPLGSGPSSSGKETPFWSLRSQNEASSPR
jgi:hypothetical protein